MNPEHIHEGSDGRGPRDVFVNGNQVKGVVYADTRKGLVRCIHQPPKLDKYKQRLITFTLKGDVVVRPTEVNNG